MIHAKKAKYPVSMMCRILGVSRSAYYDWAARTPSRRSKEDDVLLRKIKAIHKESGNTYGSPKITMSFGTRALLWVVIESPVS